MFPHKAEEFRELFKKGKDVEYGTSRRKADPPEGENWVFWSFREDAEKKEAVWRRIVEIDKNE